MCSIFLTLNSRLVIYKTFRSGYQRLTGVEAAELSDLLRQRFNSHLLERQSQAVVVQALAG